MKNLSILFFSIFSLFVYSQKQNAVTKIPSEPIDLEVLQTIDASNFKVPQDPSGNFRYSFNLSGTYFRVEIRIYKNSISENNQIIYNSLVDDSEYEPIVYPQGFTYNGYAAKPFVAANTYILELKAWEYEGQGATPAATATLSYTPPVAPVLEKPNLSIAAIQVFNSSNVKIYDSSTNPGGSFSLKKNNTYTFITKVKKTGNVAVNNVRLDLFQYDRYWGDYPNTSPSTPQTQNLNFSAGETEKNVTFLTNIINFGAQANAMGVAFHVDKNNTIAETNENDNIGIVVAGYQNRIASPEIVDVSVYDANGNFIKTVETTSNDSDFINVKSKLGSGKYILKSKEQSRQVLIK